MGERDRAEKSRQPNHKTLKGISGMLASVFLAACGSSAAPTPEPQNLLIDSSPDSASSGQVLGASIEPMAQLFSDFYNKYKGTAPDFDHAYGPQCEDLVNLWSITLGGKQFTGDSAYQIFGQQPSFYDSIKIGQGLPQEGDIVVFDNSFNNGKGGHTAIAEGRLDANGNEVVFEENGAGGINAQEASYSLNNPHITGELRAKEYETPPTPEAILDKYLPIDTSQDMDHQLATTALRFFIQEYTSKQNPVTLKSDGGETSLQISSNIDKWIANMPVLFTDSNDYWSNPISDVFDIHYNFTGRNKIESEGQAEDFQIRWHGWTNFSPEDIANGFERIEEIDFKYLWRGKNYNPATQTWNIFSDWSDNNGADHEESYGFIIKNNQIKMLTQNFSYNYIEPTNEITDPTQAIPWLVFWAGYQT